MKEIAALVGVSVPSVSLWVRDVRLTDSQRAALLRRNPALNGHKKGAAVNSARARLRRSAWQKEGRAMAQRREEMHVAGCMLYWGRGLPYAQHGRLHELRPRHGSLHGCVPPALLLRARRRFHGHVQSVRRPHRASAGNRAVLAGHAPTSGLVPQEVDRQRLFEAQPEEAAQQAPVRDSRACVHSTRIVQSIYGSIQEYGGFERPEWLG
jgi:hypothetical protein